MPVLLALPRQNPEKPRMPDRVSCSQWAQSNLRLGRTVKTKGTNFALKYPTRLFLASARQRACDLVEFPPSHRQASLELAKAKFVSACNQFLPSKFIWCLKNGKGQCLHKVHFNVLLKMDTIT